MTKHTKYVDLDKKELRESTRKYLSENAISLLQSMRSRATPLMLEDVRISRLEDRAGQNDSNFLFSRGRVEQLLTTWEVVSGPNYDANEHNLNPEESLETADEVDEFDDLTESVSKDRLQRLVCEAVGLLEAEDEEDKPIEIDVTDEDPEDDNIFIKALKKAEDEDTTIQISLDDDTTVDLDQATIKRLLKDKELVKKSLASTDNIKTFSKALELGIAESEEEDEDEEDEKDLKEHFISGVQEYLSALAPEAVYNKTTELFKEAADLNKLAAKAGGGGSKGGNKIIKGKIVQMDRIRNGKLELKAQKSDVKGYKIKNGQAVKMSPKEVKKRKIGAKFASKKRAQQSSRIARKRAISMKMRDRRIG